jgi:hypothetical protein
VHTEQGFGDTLQFVRYAPLAARRGARVILECQPELKTLFQGLEGVQEVVARGEPLPPFEMHIPLMSLPHVFGTRVENIPAEVPYLKPDPARVAAWRDKVGRYGGRLRVGLVWASTPWNHELRKRTVPPAALAPMATAKDVTFYSLQKWSFGGEEAKNPPAGIRLIDLTGDIRDFADTAALMAHLDLVISVDTAVTHLAGAMARPVWALLPFVPAWHWLLEREDNPWYPTMRLFRQRAMGNWGSVVERVAQELNDRIK